jgi:ribosome-associated toxin RatA of RatAB toxin-antitoxin module
MLAMAMRMAAEFMMGLQVAWCDDMQVDRHRQVFVTRQYCDRPPGRYRMATRVALLACLSALPLTPADAWELTPSQRAAVDAGEVLVVASPELATRESLSAGAVAAARAAVKIRAPAARVYAAMTDCTAALRFVPHLEACQVLETGASGAWQLIAHRTDLGWYLPANNYVFKANYAVDRSVEFDAVRGDFRILRGRWELQSDSGANTTVVTYQVEIAPKFRVPRWLLQRGLEQDLPDLLTALREYVERAAMQVGEPQ